MGFEDKKGITVASGFKLQAKALLDARGQVETISERDELVTLNAVTEGLMVHVKENKTSYVWNGESWDELSKGSGYTHPTSPGNKHIPAGGAEGQILKYKADGEAQWADEKTYSDATQSASGLLSATDKKKLDGIEEGANKTTVDAALNDTSTNPVQNKAVNAALAGKVPTSRKVNGKALSADISLAAADVGAIPASQKGTANGVAELGNDGKVPSAQLPSYVDDVLEYGEQSEFPQTGEDGKIYVAKDTNKTYRWSGSGYVEIAGGVALGETSSTAYRGDRGKAAYDHSQVKSGNPHGVTKSDVGLGNVSNDKQMKGLASGTTEGHVMAFGADGYTPKDTGFTIGKSVPEDAVFTDTTYSAFKGASASAAGGAGLVPAPAKGDQNKYLSANGTWQNPPTYTHPSSHPANMITQDATHRFVTDAEKEAWNAKPEIYFASELPEEAPAGSICFII